MFKNQPVKSSLNEAREGERGRGRGGGEGAPPKIPEGVGASPYFSLIAYIVSEDLIRRSWVQTP